ncbi:MAG: class I SAM-dependent methyltransferase [Planctomycetes bacterium]|nr:class I SAM-dependent methyltransferase [Planctomycetota bacterium]MCB9909166.1 class I SAM-dependent methyltransferase [Planctomycetota bacterium]HPF15038.1 class I SAM-dependent methyltransferase [Planctomycetota bacterium]
MQSKPTDLLQAVFVDTDHANGQVVPLGQAAEAPHRWVVFNDAQEAAHNLPRRLDQVDLQGTLYVYLRVQPSDRALSELRNQLWPRVHVGLLYSVRGGHLRRRTLQGEQACGPCGASGLVLVADPLQTVLSQDTTASKFDQNAKRWDGEPGSPGYPHFRWMRRFVALYEEPATPQRILDFGCGAGWVGIEAALRHPKASLSFFDPSPEMVRIAAENARLQGIQQAEGRVGFGEAPPFPGPGEARFDWVISSGVISFSPDPTAWIQGLVDTVAPGGTLVVGDIQAAAWGFKKRRRSHPLLPVRELNAKHHDEVRKALEAAGFQFLGGSGYQCTYPIPQLLHLNETRLKGWLTQPLLGLNRLAARLARLSGGKFAGAFDSWVMAFRAP